MGWYDATNHTIGVRDDQFFLGWCSVPYADRNSAHFADADLLRLDTHGTCRAGTAHGPGGRGQAVQSGNLAPNQSAHVTFYVWFRPFRRRRRGVYQWPRPAGGWRGAGRCVGGRVPPDGVSRTHDDQ